MSALFEPDRKQMSERIRAAEKLMVSREREVFGQPSSAIERRALDRAFHALRVLQLWDRASLHTPAKGFSFGRTRGAS